MALTVTGWSWIEYDVFLSSHTSPSKETEEEEEDEDSNSRKMRREDTVKLISAEGFEFVVDKEAAIVSQTIHNMLTSPGSFAETQHGEVTFPEISTTILEKICQYFYWHLQFASGKENWMIRLVFISSSLADVTIAQLGLGEIYIRNC
ncbi:hypothetical protein L6164_019244 [Bauhinia variegata]|uniref:Uncharacterized protein n=1 Tax=Bauhinia variegata TaxID=167791 RepID=A0ACB9NDQ9_BAUVA|nr:hypothetical protein L6164_019244 [Bauhinia variegata]